MNSMACEEGGKFLIQPPNDGPQLPLGSIEGPSGCVTSNHREANPPNRLQIPKIRRGQRMTGLNPPAIPLDQPIGDKGRAFVGLQPEVGINHLGQSLGQAASFVMRGHSFKRARPPRAETSIQGLGLFPVERTVCDGPACRKGCACYISRRGNGARKYRASCSPPSLSHSSSSATNSDQKVGRMFI